MYNTIGVMNMKRYRFNKQSYSSFDMTNNTNLAKNIQVAQQAK